MTPLSRHRDDGAPRFTGLPGQMRHVRCPVRRAVTGLVGGATTRTPGRGKSAMGTGRPTAHDERLERVSARLAASPALADAIRRALAQGNVPDAAAAVIPAHQAEAVAHDRQPLERIRTDALEAIVQRVGRPPLLVRNGTVELEPLVD